LRQPHHCSDSELEKAKEAVASLDEQAERARERGAHQEAEELESQAAIGHGWIREHELQAGRKRRRQPDQDSQVVKVGVKLRNNFTHACKQLRTRYGLPELAEHLDEQIDSGVQWNYRPVQGMDWSFTSS
jgi:hypothetical protein